MTMLDLTQLLRVPHIDTELRFDLSPDGENAAFSWNGSGNWEIYTMSFPSRGDVRGVRSFRGVNTQHNKEIASSQHTLLAMTSQGRGAKFAPRYSPDGKYLVYALDLDGSESYHIVLHDLETGHGEDLTPDIGYAHQPNFAFSPDGRTLAVLSNERGQFALYLLSTSTREKKLLLDIHRPIWDLVWSPDGNWIAVEVESAASDRGIHVVPVQGGEAFQLQLEDKPLNAQHPAWSPDSKHLAFSGETGEWHDIGFFNVETKRITWVNQSTGDDTQPAWSRDGSRVGWIHAEGAATGFQFKDGSAAIRQYGVGAGVHTFPHFTSDGVLVLYEDPAHPCDLWRIDLYDGSLEQLTDSLPDELKSAQFIQPQQVSYPAMDGAQVPALLYRVKDSRRAAVVIHGGPNWLFQFLWYPVMSHMASRGWTVLAPNYRGSTGYGREWMNASRYDLGGVDEEDCAAGVRFLIEQGLAEKNKIAVTGRSHGGFLAMACMTRHPGLWAAASAAVPFLNWLRSHEASREDLQHWNIENMGDPVTNRERWIANSPFFFLERISAPVQLICGENDPRCPAVDSIEARDRLQELGKQVEFILYRGEGHAFLNTDNLVDAEVKRIEFLARNLEDDHPSIVQNPPEDDSWTG